MAEGMRMWGGDDSYDASSIASSLGRAHLKHLRRRSGIFGALTRKRRKKRTHRTIKSRMHQALKRTSRIRKHRAKHYFKSHKRGGRKTRLGRMGMGRVRHTKHGQPYIILANGRARFVKKR